MVCTEIRSQTPNEWLFNMKHNCDDQYGVLIARIIGLVCHSDLSGGGHYSAVIHIAETVVGMFLHSHNISESEVASREQWLNAMIFDVIVHSIETARNLVESHFGMNCLPTLFSDFNRKFAEMMKSQRNVHMNIHTLYIHLKLNRVSRESFRETLKHIKNDKHLAASLLQKLQWLAPQM